jgi:hypothetical protein
MTYGYKGPSSTSGKRKSSFSEKMYAIMRLSPPTLFAN